MILTMPSHVSNPCHTRAPTVALHYMHDNFCRVHQSLTIKAEDGGKGTKPTPAMAAGVTDHVWTLRDIAALLD